MTLHDIGSLLCISIDGARDNFKLQNNVMR